MLYTVLCVLFLNFFRDGYTKELSSDVIQVKTVISEKPVFIGMDLCGTVIDSKESDIRAMNKTIKKFLDKNLEWKDIKYLQRPELSMKQNFPIFFGKNYKKAYKYYLRSTYSDVKNIRVFDGVFEFLEFCRANGIKTAIVTNRDIKYVKKFEKNNKLGKRLFGLVDTVVTADEAKATKPQPRILRYAIQKVDVSLKNNKNVFFIGDALADSNLVRNNVINGNFILMIQAVSDINSNYLSFLNADRRSYVFLNYASLTKSLKDSINSDALEE